MLSTQMTPLATLPKECYLPCPKVVNPPLPLDQIPAREDNDFERLIDQLKAVLGTEKLLTSKDIDHEQLKQLFRDYTSNEEHWRKFVQHDPSRSYTRNGIENINGNANLLLLVWEPGKGLFIHDHANAHCIVKVLKGTVRETLYDVPHGNKPHGPTCSCVGDCIMVPRELHDVHTDDVAYILDDIGLHRMYNPDPDNICVTLHLYTPPYATVFGCLYYEDRNGRQHHVDMSKYYLWRGVILNE